MYGVQAKCTLGNETRLVPLLGQCTIVELMHNVKAKFPDVGPFVLKYLDRCASRLGPKCGHCICPMT